MTGDSSTAKHLYVVLSRSSTALSKTIRFLKGVEYTHAALALDARLEYMFSFGRRRAHNPFVGCFKRERIGDALYRPYSELPGVVLEITVSAAQYKSAVALIESFLLDGHMYGYNYLGLAGNLWGWSRMAGMRFFCSEFVYHVLHKIGVSDLGKPRGLVSPQDLMRIKSRVIFQGNLKEYGCPAKRAAAPRLFRFGSWDAV
ncbi:MAG: hypothetical protein LBH21_06845 [Gracilibacteraceae bacterium]|nr:hypothetical protein [Gracilibacteraceae bacterium]